MNKLKPIKEKNFYNAKELKLDLIQDGINYFGEWLLIGQPNISIKIYSQINLAIKK